MQFRHKNPTHGFTIKYPALSNVLVQEGLIITEVGNNANSFKTNAIWDTGATGSVITDEVVKQLSLKQVGQKMVSTPTISNVIKPTYLVDVFLKADVRIQASEVITGTIAAEHGIHFLIGMDIITLGDFELTNFQKQTCMSFRIPSLHQVDFVQKIQKEREIVERHLNSGRNFNSPCICNSGKKFKNCHGKDWEEVKP